MVFRDKLKVLRVAKGLTQEELARELNKQQDAAKVTRSTISRWEAGLQDATMASIKMLADYFEVTLDEMNGREESGNYVDYEKLVEYQKLRESFVRLDKRQIDVLKRVVEEMLRG